MRASSSAADWAVSNADARPIQPGETLVLADLKGPGTISHIWNTISSKEYCVSKQLVLRMYWDDEKNPSVVSPLGDFFGVGHGMDVDFDSTPVRVSAGGRARNCYWPMPFRKSARITVTNEGRQPVSAFYYCVDWIQLPSLAKDTPYFHASYRQEHPCVSGQRYLVADIQGRGHYVGTVLNCRQHERGWMGEGDDFFFLDGEKEPSLRGTGTEDYFCDAWGFRESAGPFYGVTVYEGSELQDRTTAYRWHLPDPIPFTESLRFEIEHWGWWWIADDDGKEKITAGERSDDWSSVGFWYQVEPHRPHQPLPAAADRLYYDWSEVVEAESLREQAKTTGGALGDWGGGSSGELFVHWDVRTEGESLELPFEVAEAGRYSLVAILIRRSHFGVFEFLLDGRKLGPNLDLYHSKTSTREFALPVVRLDAGEHVLTVRNLGKNLKSSGYCFGLDAFLLERHE